MVQCVCDELGMVPEWPPPGVGGHRRHRGALGRREKHPGEALALRKSCTSSGSSTAVASHQVFGNDLVCSKRAKKSQPGTCITTRQR